MLMIFYQHKNMYISQFWNTYFFYRKILRFAIISLTEKHSDYKDLFHRKPFEGVFPIDSEDFLYRKTIRFWALCLEKLTGSLNFSPIQKLLDTENFFCRKILRFCVIFSTENISDSLTFSVEKLTDSEN